VTNGLQETEQEMATNVRT